MSYPELIRLLMDRAYRDERLKRVNQKLLAGSALADGLSREYTLHEIAIITRAGPARLLGLTNKGHLGAGADADITVYARDADFATMFSTPRYVLKGGTLVVEEGQLRRAPATHRVHVRPQYDPAVMRDCRAGSRATGPSRSPTIRSRRHAMRRFPSARASDVQIRGVTIEDTFAEAFGMRGARVIITARDMRWATERRAR